MNICSRVNEPAIDVQYLSFFHFLRGGLQGVGLEYWKVCRWVCFLSKTPCSGSSGACLGLVGGKVAYFPGSRLP